VLLSFWQNFKILKHFEIAIFTQFFRPVTPARAAPKEKMTAFHWRMITNGQVMRLKWSLSL
jgi:hypothetical protein